MAYQLPTEIRRKRTDVYDMIDEFLHSHVVSVFTNSKCKVCEKLKSLFNCDKIPFSNVDVDEHPLNDEIMEALEVVTGSKDPLPHVFIKGVFSGSYDIMVAYYHTGRLHEIINSTSYREYDYEVIVIGGGRPGLAVANEAAKMGRKVALFDFNVPSRKVQNASGVSGGMFLNMCSVPKKGMVNAAMMGYHCEMGDEYGWSTNFKKEGSHNWHRLMNNMMSYIVRTDATALEKCLSNNVHYINSYVQKFEDPHTIATRSKVRDMHSLFTANSFVIAFGGHQKIPTFKGAEYAITTDDLFALDNKPGRTLIIGATATGLEFAGFLNGLGIDCTILDTVSIQNFDPEMIEAIVKHMKNLGIKFLNVDYGFEITGTVFGLKSNDGETLKYSLKLHPSHNRTGDLKFNTILVTGEREYNLDSMALKHLGVKCHPADHRIIVNKFDRTDCHTIFAIGDVVHNRIKSTPVASKSGKLLGRRMGGMDDLMDYRNIPIGLFTPMEYGMCGLTEPEAVNKYGARNIQIIRNIYSAEEWEIKNMVNAMSYIKLICLKKKEMKVIGIHFLGQKATEICQGFALAMKLNATKENFESFIGVYPTITEGLLSFENINDSRTIISSLTKISQQILRKITSKK